MSRFYDASSFLRHLDKIERSLTRELEQTTGDIVDDVARISTNIAPISLGTLRRSVDKKVESTASLVFGEIGYSATNSTAGYGNFDYATWTHEFMSDGDVTNPGSYEGYNVGSHYLSRPVQGESDKYLDWWAKAVKRAVR
ncbi:hypothetical protein Q9251_03010 [Alkalihalobacillus macyae]|uniref:hypothetical protein n=1 Tax=Guptibacillus hwajinpoensis TaxID=208199 RepID=UPI00273CEADF|nr:hypothetical protein [Alkalihalobacillus macyae]MDP4549845.1 hypothetical protein [Alkalihalobacillus macyae]